MRQLAFLLFLFSLVSFSPKNDPEQIVVARIEYIYALKTPLGKNGWKNFDKRKYDVPLLYYADSCTYAANPTKKFLEIYRPALVHRGKRLSIYKVPRRIDNVLFHMETSVTTDDPARYDHLSPYMHCSSPEETRRLIEDVTTTEQWVTMVVHEYFHGFQYKHTPYLEHLQALPVTPDSLQKIYKRNAWFKEKLDKENALLLAAIGAPQKSDSLIDAFFALRNARRTETKQKLGLDIASYEKAYETMEGTARYVEYKLYEQFSQKQPDPKLSSSDTAYKAYAYFSNYSIEKDAWLYKSSQGSYYYATGFNTARLLDRLTIEYKSKLFRNGPLTLEDLLRKPMKK